MFDQRDQAFQLITKEKEVEGTGHFIFYCKRTLMGSCEKVKAIVMSCSAVLFVMFNSHIYQPKSTSKLISASMM